jgi:DNA-binding transcriptional MerR regulator
MRGAYASTTLRRYDQRGLFTTYRTPGGARRFLLREVRELAGLRWTRHQHDAG